MNDLSVIEAAIIDTLKTVTELQAVYAYEPLKLAALPAATLFYSGWDLKDFEFPNAQEVSENWAIRLYVRLVDAETAQADMKDLIPKVRDAFRDNRRLEVLGTPTCLYCLFEKGSVSMIMDGNVPCLMCEINFSAITEEQET